MFQQMTVLYLSDLGQVVAAIAHTVPPAVEPTVADVAGDAYVYRQAPDDPELAIPADSLSVATIGYERTVILDPRGHRYRDGELVAQEGKVEQALDGDGATVKLDRTPAELGEAPATPPRVEVFFRAGPTAAPLVSIGTIPLGEHTATIQPPSQPGSYDILVTAEGYRPFGGHFEPGTPVDNPDVP